MLFWDFLRRAYWGRLCYNQGMFILKKNHLFSNVLMQTAIINSFEVAVKIIVRLNMRSRLGTTMQPDMLNSRISSIQDVLTAGRLVLITLVFLYAFRKLRAVRSLIDSKDYSEMAKLQEEMIPDSISSISVYSVSQLLQIWAFVLIGVNVVHEMGSVMYQNFMSILSGNLLILNPTAYIEVYILTHGFKYIGMVTAIIIAIFATGIFLKDIPLKAFSIIFMVIFTAAFALLKMNTVAVAGRSIGIIWTSVIYHLMQTAGLFAVAWYLRGK